MALTEELCDLRTQGKWVNWMGGDGIGTRPFSKPTILGALDYHHNWRAIDDLVLQGVGQAKSTLWNGLAIKDKEVNLPLFAEVLAQGIGGGEINYLMFAALAWKFLAQGGAYRSPNALIIGINHNNWRQGRPLQRWITVNGSGVDRIVNTNFHI